MSTRSTGRVSAPRRYTSATLTGGVVVSAFCFVVAAFAELTGVTAGSGDMTDAVAVIDGLRALAPWAWATLGVYVIVLTPALGLLVTMAEYASVSDRRTVLTAVAVAAILAAGAIVALGIPPG